MGLDLLCGSRLLGRCAWQCLRPVAAAGRDGAGNRECRYAAERDVRRACYGRHPRTLSPTQPAGRCPDAEQVCAADEKADSPKGGSKARESPRRPVRQTPAGAHTLPTDWKTVAEVPLAEPSLLPRRRACRPATGAWTDPASPGRHVERRSQFGDQCGGNAWICFAYVNWNQVGPA